MHRQPAAQPRRAEARIASGGVIGRSCRTTTPRFLKPCRLTILASAVVKMKGQQPPVLPSSTAPAARMRSTLTASSSGMCSAINFEPNVVGLRGMLADCPSPGDGHSRGHTRFPRAAGALHSEHCVKHSVNLNDYFCCFDALYLVFRTFMDKTQEYS